jgi:hypothetical protein
MSSVVESGRAIHTLSRGAIAHDMKYIPYISIDEPRLGRVNMGVQRPAMEGWKLKGAAILGKDSLVPPPMSPSFPPWCPVSADVGVSGE